jgi:hypothetical protein
MDHVQTHPARELGRLDSGVEQVRPPWIGFESAGVRRGPAQTASDQTRVSRGQVQGFDIE